MRKLNKCLATLIGMSLVIGMMGTLAFAAEKELTPYEFTQLAPQEKVEYKTIRLLWPSWMGGDGVANIAKEKEWKKFDEVYVNGDIGIPIGWYSKALFMLAHPKVKIEQGFISWYPQEMMPQMAAGTASYITPITWQGGPYEWHEKGLIADITDLVKNWDQTPHLQANLSIKSYWSMAWLNGRCYGVPRQGNYVIPIVFRKDWFKEAGVFDGNGKPGPSWNWTWQDFRSICKKLTNEKEKRWGISLSGMVPELQTHYPCMVASSLGMIDYFSLLVPDRSDKYTWKFEVIPPIVKAYQYFQDLRWKDKSLLFSSGAQLWDPHYKDLLGGRTGIAMDPSALGKGKNISPFRSEHSYSEDIGMAPLPSWFSSEEKGIMNAAGAGADLWAFTANLSKEELKAAFEYWDWNRCGRGRTLELERIADLLPLIGKETSLYPVFGLPQFSAYKIREIPAHLPEPADLIGKEYAELWPLLLKKYEIGLEQPLPSNYGLRVDVLSVPAAEYAYLQSAYQTIMTDAKADVKAELEKIASLVNKECFSYKIKDDKEKFKNYYTAVADYFKKYYPEFYQSEKFKEMWEKYYKVW